MKNFLLVGAVGRTKADIIVSNSHTSENREINSDLVMNSLAEDN
jgi:hypothetical protein